MISDNPKSIEKSDKLFELIFELDRRLQSSQNRQSPLSNLLETFEYLEIISSRLGSETIDTIFLKLIDFFIKCNCNFKRFELSKFLRLSGNNWIIRISSKNVKESLKRISSLWDQSILTDFETCNQILILFKDSLQIYFDQPTVYGIFFESFMEEFLDSFNLISVTLKYFEKLFEELKLALAELQESQVENPTTPKLTYPSTHPHTHSHTDLDVFIKNSNLSALIIQNSNISKYFHDKNLRKDSYKIVLIASIISGKFTIEIPNDLKDSFPDLIQYL